MLRKYPSTLLGLAALMAAGAGPAFADDCTKEAFEALKKQTEQPGFRLETDAISEEGPLKVVTEYVLPGRARQIATLAADNKPVETILVDGQAWSNEGGEKFVPLTFQHTEMIIEHMRRSTKADPETAGKFECMGTETVDGRQVRVYKSKPFLPGGVKGTDGKEIETTAKNEAVRMFYVDAETGLLAKVHLVRQDALDKPINKEVYTYPKDLKIEPPAADKIVPR